MEIPRGELPVRGEGLHSESIGGFEPVGLDPKREPIAAMRLNLNCLHNPRVTMGVSSEMFEP